MIKKIFLMLSITLCGMIMNAQDISVSGTILDANGKPIGGALVIEKGTNNAIRTKSDGSYSLSVAKQNVPATVQVRAVGYGSSEVLVDGSNAAVTYSPVIGAPSRSLNDIVISASKKSEKILNAPASVSILSEERLKQNTSLSVVDNLRKVAGVDLAPTGLVSNNVVVRGFNNIFSGASMFMVDNRLASVPSLRVNAFQLVPTSNADIASMEVVRGPASALYGPFAANGVISVFTKSPLDMDNRMEVTLGLTSGLRAGDDDNATYNFKANNSIENLGIINPELRIAGKLSNNVGVRVSANYLSASDFAFFDPREPVQGSKIYFGNLSGGNPWKSDGTGATSFNRNFGIRKLATDARLDWRVADKTEFIFGAGYSDNTNMELTGLGAAQAKNWISSYFQTQFKKDRFFAQYFINSTNSGNTFLIPQSTTDTAFTYLKENSSLQALQLQHSANAFANKLNLVYGFDMYMTRPSGNVYGRFDNKANINQYGGYLQGEYKFNKQWSVVAASRLDYQDAIDEWMISPRGAIVYKPSDNQTFRVTYNRSFSSPTALNYYLDLYNGHPGTRNVRAFGNSTGFNYNRDATGQPTFNVGGAAMNLATLNAANTLVNASYIPQLNTAIAGLLVLQAKGAGITLPTSSAASLASFITGTASFPGMIKQNPSYYIYDLVSRSAINPNLITNVDKIKSTVTQTAELGYKGFVMDKLSLGIDLYYTRMENFVSPLTSASYGVSINPSYYSGAGAAVIANNLSKLAGTPYYASTIALLSGGTNDFATAVKNAATLTTTASAVAPVSTVAPNNTGTGTDIILAYYNLGTVDVAGGDFSFSYAATKALNVEGAFSFTNKNKIYLLGAANGFVSLNAPQYKSALNIDYKLPVDNNSLTARLGWRWMDQFDANSGYYTGRVDAANFVDLGLSWRPSTNKNTVLSLNVNNLLDNRHAFFPYSSPMGRVALFKIQHTFG